jgi:hypothetical protein
MTKYKCLLQNIGIMIFPIQKQQHGRIFELLGVVLLLPNPMNEERDI